MHGPKNVKLYTRLIQCWVLYVLVHVITTVLRRNVVEHVRLILKTKIGPIHARPSWDSKLGTEWRKEKLHGHEEASDVFLTMLKDTAMADGRYKYSTGGVVLKILLIPWSRVLLEKLAGSQLVKKFPAFYGTRRFITAFTSARHLSLS